MEFDGDFLSSWKPGKLNAGAAALDLGDSPPRKTSKKLNLPNFDMDLDGGFNKLSSFKIDLSGLDLSPPKKLAGPNKGVDDEIIDRDRMDLDNEPVLPKEVEDTQDLAARTSPEKASSGLDEAEDPMLIDKAPKKDVVEETRGDQSAADCEIMTSSDKCSDNVQSSIPSTGKAPGIEEITRKADNNVRNSLLLKTLKASSLAVREKPMVMDNAQGNNHGAAEKDITKEKCNDNAKRSLQHPRTLVAPLRVQENTLKSQEEAKRPSQQSRTLFSPRRIRDEPTRLTLKDHENGIKSVVNNQTTKASNCSDSLKNSLLHSRARIISPLRVREEPKRGIVLKDREDGNKKLFNKEDVAEVDRAEIVNAKDDTDEVKDCLEHSPALATSPLRVREDPMLVDSAPKTTGTVIESEIIHMKEPENVLPVVEDRPADEHVGDNQALLVVDKCSKDLELVPAPKKPEEDNGRAKNMEIVLNEADRRSAEICKPVDNDIIAKADKCAKDLDNMYKMLKQKHEEAKDLLVRALVSNNQLLMLSNPVAEEKFQVFRHTVEELLSERPIRSDAPEGS